MSAGHAGDRVPSSRRLRRRVGAAVALGLLVTLAAALWHWRELASWAVTRLAFRDAERIAEETIGSGQDYGPDIDRRAGEISRRYGGFFRRGLLDRDEVGRRFPASGMTPEALPAALVITAFYDANDEAWRDERLEDTFLREFPAWLYVSVSKPHAKEALVNTLTEDWTLLERKEWAAGLPKRVIAGFLFCGTPGRPWIDALLATEDGWPELRDACVRCFGEAHWGSVGRDLSHPREKVRAGALLLLYFHPAKEIFSGRAREALVDPSALVRLAAAGLLALRGERGGERDLLAGLAHPRWELRWWSWVGLTAIGDTGYMDALYRRWEVEQNGGDDWLLDQIGEMGRVFEGKEVRRQSGGFPK